MSEEGAGTSERVLLGEKGAGDSEGLREGVAMKLTDLKIAVGHDDLTVPYAGGEKVFSAIAEAFPKADIFTSMITDQWRSRLPGRKILTPFMQSFPLKRKLPQPLLALYPLAFESLDLSDYDLV